MTSHQKLEIWKSFVREVLCTHDCSLVICTKSNEGKQVMNIDCNQSTLSWSLSSITVPVDLLFVLQMMSTLIMHTQFHATFMCKTQIQHALLSDDMSEQDNDMYYYDIKCNC